MIIRPDSGTCVEPAVFVSHQSSQSSEEEIFRVLSENTNVLYEQHQLTCQEHVKNMSGTCQEHVKNM